jgi:hypothetical protein
MLASMARYVVRCVRLDLAGHPCCLIEAMSSIIEWIKRDRGVMSEMRR